MFTRRHYKAIAEVLWAKKPPGPVLYELPQDRVKQQIRRDYYDCLVERFAEMFAQDNPRFDGQRFLAACGEE